MNIPSKLLSKLLAINSMAIVIVILTIGLAIHLRAADYFSRLTAEYKIDPADAHAMFLLAVDRYLFIASLIGFFVASVLSLWLNYRLTRPITMISKASALISEGDYTQRVTVRGCGEIDQLSAAFNAMADRLLQTDQLRKTFIVDVAHELRTPLTNIRGYIEGLRDQAIEPDRQVFELLHEESLRLVNLVEDLLQLARADVARPDLNPELFGLGSLINQSLRTFQPRFQEKSITVTTALSSTPLIYADPQRMGQVLRNLLENCLRYSPVGGAIHVCCESRSNCIRATIVNDVERQTALPESPFERFTRGEASRSRMYGGAGLGLAVVRQLIEAHRGQVGMQLENGRVQVWFELPTALLHK